METITITHRSKNGKDIYNKRFDDYEKGFFGKRISKKEFLIASKKKKKYYEGHTRSLHILKRFVYEN